MARDRPDAGGGADRGGAGHRRGPALAPTCAIAALALLPEELNLIADPVLVVFAGLLAVAAAWAMAARTRTPTEAPT